VKTGLISLIVPGIVLDEFRRNKERVAKESGKSLSSHFRLVKDAVDRAGGDKRAIQAVLSHLDDVGHKLPIVGGAAKRTLERIEALLTAAPVVDVSDSIRLGAAQRAIEQKAPF